MKHLIPLLTFLLLLSCKKAEEVKEPILLADREAPLGWIYLRIYADSTFEFESRGLRKGTIYSGHAHITKDSILFHYNDSVPYAGSRAVYNKRFVSYDASKNGRETLEIKVSKLGK